VTKLLLGRMLLTAIGIVVWGYGSATSQTPLMYAGMGILAVALLLRFVPKRWFQRDDAS
jgi:hypothetical protein